MPEPRRVRIVIVGGRFAGIGMAIRLRARGIRDFVIFERVAVLGGTWRVTAIRDAPATSSQRSISSLSRRSVTGAMRSRRRE